MAVMIVNKVNNSADGVEVSFSVRAETSPGDRVVAVGAAAELGAWRPFEGLELTTGPEAYPRWSGAARLPHAGACSKVDDLGHVEYKFVILRRDGGIDWESGDNRRLSTSELLASCTKLPLPAKEVPCAPRFGETKPDGPQAHAILRSPGTLDTAAGTNGRSPRSGAAVVTPSGVPRADISLASTCVLDDDSPSLTTTSRGASSVCLPFLADKISEIAEDEAQDQGESTSSYVLPGRLWAGACRAPKQGGRCEDAYFYSGRAVGVADGVGQMADYERFGIDAAAYADELMELSAKSLSKDDLPGSPRERTGAAIAAAEKGASTFGATTITVAEIEGSTLGITNLGDSGFILLRPKPWGMELVDRSREMNHGWNCPYQLTRIPKQLMDRMGHRSFDTANDAERCSLDVEVGDLLLLFTDGLTDNLHWFELLRLIDDVVGPNCADAAAAAPTAGPDAIAKALVSAAAERSVDEAADTPFSKNARRHRRFDCPGGKIDDVTVVAAWIMPSEDESPEADAAFKEATLGCRKNPAGFRRVDLC